MERLRYSSSSSSSESESESPSPPRKKRNMSISPSESSSTYSTTTLKCRSPSNNSHNNNNINNQRRHNGNNSHSKRSSKFDKLEERARNNSSDYDSDCRETMTTMSSSSSRRSRSRSPSYDYNNYRNATSTSSNKYREYKSNRTTERDHHHYNNNNNNNNINGTTSSTNNNSIRNRRRSWSSSDGGGNSEKNHHHHHHQHQHRWDNKDDFSSTSSRKTSSSSSNRGYGDNNKYYNNHHHHHHHHRHDDDRDSDSEPNGVVLIGASGSEIIGYKSQPPNNTIMIRGLAQHITENDIRQDIILGGLMPKDIRLIRKKDTGASRGFAFVEFTTLNEAVRWMEMKQGILMLQDHYRAIMQFSIPKDTNPIEKPLSYKASADWFCIKCGAQNFKRRDNCFKCHASRAESEEGGSGSDETCSYTTKTLMFRNLDALTTEDSVMSVLSTVIPDLIKSVSAVCIGRDPLTSTSRGICYLGTESTIDALAIFGILSNLKIPLQIDGKTAILSYCKYNMGDTKRAYSQADHAAFPNASIPQTYSLTDVENLAEYAARRYAKSPEEYLHYMEYYRQYFTQQISAGNSITLHNENQMDAANAAAAVAHSAIQQMHASKNYFDTTHIQIPTGTDGKRYPIPDISTYIFDKTTGYQYDPSTGLYYDPNSTYYWNSITQKYLFWEHHKCTYLLAPSYDNFETNVPLLTNRIVATSNNVVVKNTNVQQQQQQEENVVINTKLKPQQQQQQQQQSVMKNAVVVNEKQDKVKVAKKIAKDMERWAKTLNQRKDCNNTVTTAFRSSLSNDTLYNNNYSNNFIADIGFNVLEKKTSSTNNSPILHDAVAPSQLVVLNSAASASALAGAAVVNNNDLVFEKEKSGGGGGLVAEYGGESDQSSGGDGETDIMMTDHEDTKLLDFTKLICNLCKRQLGSAEALHKHAKMSALHKQNLDARNNKTTKKTITKTASAAEDSTTSILLSINNSNNKIIYRDRAKERRMKYGDPDEAQPSKLKEKYLKNLAIESAASAVSSGVSSVAASAAASSSISSTVMMVPVAASVTEPIGVENVGNRLLQKMGWSEGQGLGKTNQGRTTIIQAEQYGNSVGLGNKTASFIAGESYKDCVKKMMYARYQELTERENTAN